MDIWDKAQRSWCMSRIKNKNTRIEMQVRRFLFAHGYRYRANDKRYPGSPDIVLPRYGAAVFVHGCFWHGHDCKIAHLPKTNAPYWKAKIDANRRRDREKELALAAMGFRVIRVWECELKYDADSRLIDLLGEIRGVDYNLYR